MFEYFGGDLKHVRSIFVGKKEAHFGQARSKCENLLDRKNFITHERKG